MRSIFILVVAACMVIAACGQGTVTFANNTATAITNVSAVGFSRFSGRVGLYGSTSWNLTDDSSLSLIGAATDTFAPGLFLGGTRSISNLPGYWVTLQVRAWAGDYPSFEAALAGFYGGDPGALLGKSAMWVQATGSELTPPQPITGPGRLMPFLVSGPITPEPSSIALAILGVTMMGCWRYRNRK